MAVRSTSSVFACVECGYRTGKWMGFCPQCRQRGSLQAEASATPAAAVFAIGEVDMRSIDRMSTGIRELDRTLGGGMVPGSAIVLGGEPGVGKSTLILQAAAGVAGVGGPALIVCAEESGPQIAVRAARLGGDYSSVELTSTADVDEVVALAAVRRPAAVMVDSIQSLATADIDSPAGSVGQVRECGARLVAFAKRSGIPVLMIGHVTKEGTLGGPRVLEHMVDVVLHFEGDPHRGVRFLRGVKNRFGPTPALGLFEMRSDGLVELENPSAVVSRDATAGDPGVVLFPAIEGRRPLVVEIQALVAPASGPLPRRSVKGIEASRLHQVLAVLERHAGLRVAGRDVYVAVVGGVRLREPAADLAVALAVASSASDVPLSSTAAWGEVGLTGRIRPVAGDEPRHAELDRLGVARCIRYRDDSRRMIDALALAGIAAPTPAAGAS